MINNNYNILVDLRIVNNYKTGIGRFLELYENLFKLNIENLKFYLLVLPELNIEFDYENVIILKKQIPVFSLKEQILIPILLKKYKIKLYHSIYMFLPYYLPKSIKKIVTIHDIITLRYKHTAKFYVRLYDHYMLKNCIKKADKIITDSEFSKKDILSYTKNDMNKIEVVNAALSDKFKLPGKNKINEVRMKYKLPDKFLLYVGGRKPHKNINIIIETINYQIQNNIKTFPVYIIGKSDNRYNKPELLVSKYNLQKKVFFLNYIEDIELICFYRLAEIFIWPSLYEGFGIPILEAMSLGTPVITTYLTSHKEVGGNAVSYFEAENKIDLSNCISKIIEEKEYKLDLIKKGLLQAEKFNWKKSAEKYLKIYNELL